MSSREEYDLEMKRKNYSRAAWLAEDGGLGDQELEKARDLAFKQAVGEYFNFRGAEAMVKEWGFDSARVKRICDDLIAAFVEREKREGRKLVVFDIDRMDHTPVITLVGSFRDSV